MSRIFILFLCEIGAVLYSFSIPALGAETTAGKMLFRQQCSICHSAETGDNGGAQGPSLSGVFNRRAGSTAGFSYTTALRTANLYWDAATLKRFLAAPTTVVPGTAMVIAVPNDADRDNLVAYLKNLAHTEKSADASKDHGAQTPDVPAASQISADWKLDAPGRLHRIDLTALPSPYATPSTRNNPALIPQPANATLALPPGFHIEPFTTHLLGPRKMLLAPNGDILISETSGGRISILHPSPDGTRSASTDVYLQGLKQPFGLAFYPNIDHPQWLYIAETNRITRYAYKVGDIQPSGVAQVVVPQLDRKSVV